MTKSFIPILFNIQNSGGGGLDTFFNIGQLEHVFTTLLLVNNNRMKLVLFMYT